MADRHYPIAKAYSRIQLYWRWFMALGLPKNITLNIFILWDFIGIHRSQAEPLSPKNTIYLNVMCIPVSKWFVTHVLSKPNCTYGSEIIQIHLVELVSGDHMQPLWFTYVYDYVNPVDLCRSNRASVPFWAFPPSICMNLLGKWWISHNLRCTLG